MNFHVITLFPDSFSSYLNESILARAIKNKKIKVSFYNPRDFVKVPKSQKLKDKPYKRIDDIPYGGGPGMVMQVEPIVKAVEKALKNIRIKKPKIKIIFLSPDGKQFDTQYAKDSVKKYTDIVVICGRYEGIDERVNKIFKTEKITVGPFVLTGGELPAMIMIDCMSRQIDGVLGNFSSREEERISSSLVYTRPEVFKYKNKNYKVPSVLLSGNHKEIEQWKQAKSSASGR
ncbi:MAG: tRNA (guanosine(37)-N1)-methyltransferase TrmD [Candidatus Paceibacterota bacterium]|jgi:tRNA (guanine37-N1)-methyltransferase